MNTKIYYAIAAFLLLFGIVYFMEDNPENITETTYWKENWKTIVYIPPKEDWCEGEGNRFVKETLEFHSDGSGWKSQPLYTLKGSTNEKPYQFEGNYNLKNSFSELSALKTKIIEKNTESLKSTYCLNESSPKLILSTDSNFDINSSSNRVLSFGKKITSDEGRVAVLVNEEVIAPFNYIIEKFRSTAISFRERTLVPSSSGYLKTIEFKGPSSFVHLENRAEKNQYGNFVNKWSRTTGERVVISPDIGNGWEGAIKALRADLYFEEPGAPDPSVILEAKEPEAILTVEPSEGRKIQIHFFRKFDTPSGAYRLLQREISPHFKETPLFVKEETFVKIVESMERVKSASRYERPNQKIQ